MTLTTKTEKRIVPDRDQVYRLFKFHPWHW